MSPHWLGACRQHRLRLPRAGLRAHQLASHHHHHHHTIDSIACSSRSSSSSCRPVYIASSHHTLAGTTTTHDTTTNNLHLRIQCQRQQRWQTRHCLPPTTKYYRWHSPLQRFIQREHLIFTPSVHSVDVSQNKMPKTLLRVSPRISRLFLSNTIHMCCKNSCICHFLLEWQIIMIFMTSLRLIFIFMCDISIILLPNNSCVAVFVRLKKLIGSVLSRCVGV